MWDSSPTTKLTSETEELLQHSKVGDERNHDTYHIGHKRKRLLNDKNDPSKPVMPSISASSLGSYMYPVSYTRITAIPQLASDEPMQMSNAALLPLDANQTLPISLLYMVFKMVGRIVVEGI